MSPSPVTVLIEYRARPEHVDQALSDLDRLVATVVATEPDCFEIRILRDPEDPARLLLNETWTSREAYLGPHFQTPHLLAFREKSQGLFAGPPVIQFWLPHSDHSRRNG